MDSFIEEKIFRIASDFSQIYFEKIGRRDFVFRKDRIKQNKYFKYFLKLDEWANEGKIVLPYFIEAQFISNRWGKFLYPNQLISKRALEVWDNYQKNKIFETKSPLDEDDLIVEIFNRIKTDCLRKEFVNKFYNDNVFDFDSYLYFKQSIGDSFYKMFLVLRFTDDNIESIKEKLKLEVDKYKDKEKDINNLNLNDAEKSHFKKEEKRKLVFLIDIVKSMIKYQKE